MIMHRARTLRRVASELSALALVTLLAGAEVEAFAIAYIEPAEGQAAPASPPPCSPGQLAYERLSHIPIALLLTGHGQVSLRRVDAFLLARPELLRLERFDASALAGVLRNGCVIEFRGTQTAAATFVINEVRVLGPLETLGPDYRYLRQPQARRARTTPTFAGYRLLMSSALDPGGRSFIGLWRRTDGSPGSLVAMYDADGAQVTRLGMANWAYDAVYPLLEVDTFGFTLVDEPDGGEPLYMTSYNWIQTGPYARHRRRR